MVGGKQRERVREFGIDVYTPICLKQGQQGPMYSTGNSAQYWATI